MWVYEQITGSLWRDEVFRGVGYSGRGVGLNNPLFENVRNVGPIPCGWWGLGAPVEHTHLGPYAIPLTPTSNTDTFGRASFYIHGDRIDCATHPHQASDGCIILPYKMRQQMQESGEELEVITGLPEGS